MTTLSSMLCSPYYNDLTPTFDIEAHLIPPTVHAQHIDAMNTYKQFSRTIILHLQKSTTISSTMAPRAALILK